MHLKVPRYEGGVSGLPAQALVLTNSERLDAACARKWWFRHAEGLRSAATQPMQLGTAWHEVMEDVHRWYFARDASYARLALVACPWCFEARATGAPVVQATREQSAEAPPGPCWACGGSGMGVVPRVRVRWLQEVTDEARRGGWAPDVAAVEERADHLLRLAEGWLEVMGGGPYDNFRVVGTEVAACRAIVSPRSWRPFKPAVDLVHRESTGEWRMASSGEVSGARPLPEGWQVVRVRWPWYQTARFDLLLQHRRTGVIDVGEFKTSRDPKRLLRGLLQDTQTVGYCWVLEDARERLGLQGEIGGVMYDVTATGPHRDPQLLKTKPGAPLKLSVSKTAAVPSWRFRAALQQYGLQPGEYAEYLQHLKVRDGKLYRREWFPVGPERVDAYEVEVWALAQRNAALRRAAGALRDTIDLDSKFPRTPVCRTTGSCPYAAPCVLDGADVRRNYTVELGLRWSDDRDEDEPDDSGDAAGGVGW